MYQAPTINFRLVFPGSIGEPSLFDLTVNSDSVLNPLFPVSGTTYDAWCLDKIARIDVPGNYTGNIYSTYEIGTITAQVSNLAGNAFLGNLDNINWLINYYDGSNPGITSGEVQAAIWGLLGQDWTTEASYLGPVDQGDVDSLVSLALANDGFVPGDGDSIAVLVDASGSGPSGQQPLIIEVKAARLGDRVFEDLDGDGLQDAGEAGIAGAAVALVRDMDGDGRFDSAGELLATTTTNDEGAYLFAGLTPGLNYQVRFTTPANYDAVSPRQADGSAASGANSDGLLSDVLVLRPGESNYTVDAGFYRYASLGDRVWLDANGNGQQDGGEAGVGNVTVRLVDAGGNVVATRSTADDGSYQFLGLNPGSYSVQFVAPTGYVFTSADAAGDSVDSDAGADGRTGSYTLPSGGIDTSVDAGLVQRDQPLARIGNRVFEDANANGVQDAGELGVAGATILLKDAAGNVVQTTTTDGDGLYGFDVAAGTYSLQVVVPDTSGYEASPQDAGGDDTLDSDIDAFGMTGPVTVAAGEVNNTIDMGGYRRAQLGDRVWLDADGNGQQDAGEAGVAGVTVRLLDSAGLTVAEQATDGSGNYLFSGLMPGRYSVEFVQPAGYDFTGQDSGADGSDSDASTTTGRTAQITLNSFDDNRTVDAGLVLQQQPRALLGDTVFLDKNANGVQDAGELGLGGITVYLKDGGGNVVQTTTTDGNGQYGFGVTPGDYSVQVAVPTGYQVSPTNAGGNDATDSDIDATGQTGSYTLADGQTDLSADAGLYQTATIGNRVWYDSNANGVQDAGEAGAAGVLVTLRNPDRSEVLGTTTDADGMYLFSGVKPGDYFVDIDSMPAGYDFTRPDLGADDTVDSDVDSGFLGWMPVTTLESGETDLSWDAGLVSIAAPLAHIGNRVFEDANANGVQDAGELGVAGATILLKDAVGNVVQTTTTDGDGLYGFDVAAGTYSLQVVVPDTSGYAASPQDAGGDDTLDSDIDAFGMTGPVTVAAGEVNNTIDMGGYRRAQLGDRVWLDTDRNGQQDAGEAGVAGVTVRLLDSAGLPVAEQATDGSGNYLFSGLMPGRYSVEFVQPAGYDFTGQDSGADGSDSDAAVTTGRTAQITLNSFDDNRTVDAGLVAQPEPGAVSGTVLEDLDNDGDGDTSIAGVTVVLKDMAGNVVATTTTGALGGYEFNNLPAGSYTVHQTNLPGYNDVGDIDGGNPNLITVNVPAGGASTGNDFIDDRPARLGDRVWLDSNANGQQDSGEAGVSGVTVNLLDNAGNVVGTQTTDGSGNYLFSGLDAGRYSVAFDKPAGRDFTVQDSGADTGDSDADSLTGRSAIVTLNSGDDNRSVDAGLVPVVAKTGSIGNLVFEDRNYNGLQDADDKGIAGVTVRLLGAAGNVLGTTTTDSSGQYLFSNLNAGDYKVQVAAPTGYYLTKANQGGDDAIDSDPLSGGTTATVSLAAGENNSSVDAGLYRKACLGDKVWSDANHNGVQDAGEGGIACIRVKLFDGSGSSLLASTITDANGNYRFTSLDPGQYVVQFDKTNVVYKVGKSQSYDLNGWSWALKDAGSSDAADSDVNQAGSKAGTARTDVITLQSGQYDNTVDAGITPILIDLDGNGIQTVGLAQAGGSFDLFGNGSPVVSGWAGRGDGFLAIDRNGNGRIDDITELFGGTQQGAGFAQLGSFDSNGDGQVNAADAGFDQLLVWRDGNGNHATEAGELMSLAQAGIASLGTGFQVLPAFDDQGNLHVERGSATLADGRTVDMTDVYFGVSADDAAAAGAALPSMAELLGDDRALDGLLGAGIAAPAMLPPPGNDHSDGAGEAAEVLRHLGLLTRDDSHHLLMA
jgi:serine-aspartate repeat-containing protein C/D/E